MSAADKLNALADAEMAFGIFAAACIIGFLANLVSQQMELAIYFNAWAIICIEAYRKTRTLAQEIEHG